MDRREFLRRSALTAAVVPSAAAILAACSKPGTVSTSGAVGTGGLNLGGPYPIAAPDAPVTWDLLDENPMIADGLQPESGATLEIYNWDAYLWKKVVQDFCAKYDCDFRITTFTNMDEALAKMRTGELRYDVFFPTTDVLGKLVSTQLLQPLNHSYLPHLQSDVWPVYRSPYYDVEARYSVPYIVYTAGIAYRRDVVGDDAIRGLANPYDILADARYRGRVGVLDSYRDTIGEMLLRNGITDVNTESDADLALAERDLLALVDAVDVRTTINGSYQGLPQGEFDLHVSWSGDAVAAPFYLGGGVTAEDLGYWFPSDRKGLVASDTITVPRNAEHPVLAHLFLDHMLGYEAAMKNFAWTGYQPPQNDADPDRLTSDLSVWGTPYVLPGATDAVVRPEDFEVGYQQRELTPAVDELWHDVWQRFQVGAA